MRTAKIGPDLSVTTGNGRHTVYSIFKCDISVTLK